jgi:hypothetical protein
MYYLFGFSKGEWRLAWTLKLKPISGADQKALLKHWARLGFEVIAW